MDLAGWTCTGSCGTLGADGTVTLSPVAGTTSYGWVSTSGSNKYGLAPASIKASLAAAGGDKTTNGSKIASEFFTANAGATLDFYFNYVSSDGAGMADYAWARLLDDAGNEKAMLFTSRTKSSGATVPGQGMPPLPPGVTLTPASAPILAGTVWSPLGSSSGDCFGSGCGHTGWVHVTYPLPATGTYQLEFGVANWSDASLHSGLAFDGATLGQDVPNQPSSVVMLSKTTAVATLRASTSINYTLTATNTTPDVTHTGDYVFYEVVPAHTIFTSLAPQGGINAQTDCLGSEPAGTKCTITIHSDIAYGTPAEVTFTVTTDNLQPGPTQIFNQLYYAIPPPGCALTETPVCNPEPPPSNPPTACHTGDPACTAWPTTLPNVVLSQSTPSAAVQPSTAIAYTLTATDTTQGAPWTGGYTFYAMVPADTTFTSFTPLSGTSATITGCTAGDPEGTLCTITITSAIASGAPAQMTFTVTTLPTLPANASIINQLYYATLPEGCSLTGTPVCNPEPPPCSGGICTPPRECPAVGDPGCVSNITLAPPASPSVPAPVDSRWMLTLLALMVAAGAGYATRRRQG
ncbi:MAG: NF038132 family protein [Rhodanobacter sp.]|nr:NF038132 family protein [Rhodanobacter sp.]